MLPSCGVTGSDGGRDYVLTADIQHSRKVINLGLGAASVRIGFRKKIRGESMPEYMWVDVFLYP